MITLYSSDTCAPCATLKTYLDRKGVEYRTLNADNDHNSQILIKLTGQRIVPTLVKGDRVVVGLNWPRIAELVNG